MGEKACCYKYEVAYLSSGCSVVLANGYVSPTLKGAAIPGVWCGEVADMRCELQLWHALGIGCLGAGLMLPKSSWIKWQREESVVQIASVH